MKVQADKSLLPYCTSDIQRERVQILIDCDNDFNAAAKLAGVTKTPLYEMVQRIQKRAIQKDLLIEKPAGKYQLLTEMVKSDHEYTEAELIEIVRALKLEDPEKFITRAHFRATTSIPDSAWSHIFGTFEEFVRQAAFSLSRHQHAMEKKVAIHKSRDHYGEGNERRNWAGLYLNKNTARIKTNLVFSDTHDVLIDPFYRRVLIETCAKINPDRVIMNGDLFDLAEFGKYGIDPRKWDVVGRIKAVHSLIEALREAAPYAEFWFLEGNHEFRLVRHLMDQTPAMRAVLSDLHGWDVKSLLGLDKYEINYVSKADLRASRVGEINKEVGKSYHLFDDCYLVGHYRMNLGFDGTNGHDHKFMAWPVRKINGGAGTWMQLGCGHVIDADYCNAETIWNLGFAITHTDSVSRCVNQQYIPITDFAEVGGEYFYREQSEMVGAFVRRAA